MRSGSTGLWRGSMTDRWLRLEKQASKLLRNTFWRKKRDKTIAVMLFECPVPRKRFFTVSWVIVRHSVTCSDLPAAPRNNFSVQRIFFLLFKGSTRTWRLKAFISFYNSHKQVRSFSDMFATANYTGSIVKKHIHSRFSTRIMQPVNSLISSMITRI